MKTVLITAYAINPYKGSEDAMGWNMILQALRYHQVIAVTRKNNRPFIEKFILEHPGEESLSRLVCWYFDWPAWMLRWKKGPLLSMFYYYAWQLTLALWLLRKRPQVDIVHNLNFHNDWTPSFLWILAKPLVWGQVGHHDKIPRQYILPVYGMSAYLRDRVLWCLKNIFWYADPFLYLCKEKATAIICINQAAVEKLRLKRNFIIHPSVAADAAVAPADLKKNDGFHVLSVGRLVPLKGFDLTIKGFAAFYHALPVDHQQKVRLTIAGSGPAASMLHQLAEKEGVADVVHFVEWMPREQVCSLYAGASAFLYPSHEGAGMVVPEAMSFGLPVICLSNNGPGTLVPPDSKLKVTPGNYSHTVQQLSGKLFSLLNDSGFLCHEQQLAADRYNRLFRWNVRGDMLAKIYDYATEKINSSSPA